MVVFKVIYLFKKKSSVKCVGLREMGTNLEFLCLNCCFEVY